MRLAFGLVAAGAGVLLLLAGGSARAQEPRELTAEEAVRLGLERNAALRASRADAAAARAGYAQVRAARLPALRGEGNFTRLSNNIPPVAFTLPGTDSTFTFQAVELNRFDAALSVEQPIFSGGRLLYQARAARQQADAAALAAEQARADVALDIRRAYWELYRALAVRDAVNASVRHVEEHLRDVRNASAAGTTLRRDVLAAETRRSEVLLERVEADNAVRVGVLELNRLIGLPLDTPLRPVSQVSVDSTAGDAAAPAAGAPSSAAASPAPPRVEAQAAQVRGLRATLQATQGGRLPQLSLVGRYLFARPNPYFFAEQERFHSTWELGVAARWGIWEGGRAGAQVAEARARLDAAEARLAETREQNTVQLARQQLEVRRAADAVGVSALNLAAAEESFRVARQQYGEGAALSSDVLEAEQALRRAQANRAGTLADYAVARAALLDLLGRVW